MKRKAFYFGFLALLSIVMFAACTSGGGDDSGDDGDTGGGNGDGSSFLSDCGTVIDGELENPVSSGDGEFVSGSVSDANLVVLNTSKGQRLVKLHGIDRPSSEGLRNRAKSILANLLAGGATYFGATELDADGKPVGECTTTLPQGGRAVVGGLFTTSGVSFSERLLSEGVVEVNSDPCGGFLLESCYDAILDDAQSRVAGEIDRLLWKPVSDSNGRLAVHSSPYDTTVVVNGETGTNAGPGNGYGSLARFSKPGCAYGSAKVEVLNEEGLHYTFNGQTTLTIPNGCQRYCYESGSLVACSR